MASFSVKKGKDIKLKGRAEKKIADLPLPRRVAIQPPDFKGIKPRLVAKLNDPVKVGTPVISDKQHPEINIVSPVSGYVVAVNRGNKRALLEIIIEADGKQDAASFKKYSADEISSLSREEVTKHLLLGGVWPVLRERPFSKLADPEKKPKAIFVHAMNTEPLAADTDFILENDKGDFQAGLNVLTKLTEGKVHLCFDLLAKSQALVEAENVETHTFTGAHPAGNVSTHIHYVDPIQKGEIVWYIEAQDVIRIAKLFLQGAYPVGRIVAVTGEGVTNPRYVKTIMGAPIKDLAGNISYEGKRVVSGSVLAGRDVGKDGFLSFYDSQITVFPQGGKRELLGWLLPGADKYSFSSTFLSSFLPEKSEVSLDADEHGGHRAIVINDVYDDYNTLGILTYFLLKAVLSGEIEEAERLGILECDEEDFALCTFACPSKIDVGGIIASGLDLIEKEG